MIQSFVEWFRAL